MAYSRGTKKKTASSNRRDNMYERLDKAEKNGTALRYGGANRTRGGHEEIEAYKHNDSHDSRESKRTSEYFQERRKAKKASYNGHAAEGAGARGGNSQRGKYVPEHHKSSAAKLNSQRSKYGKGSSRTIHAPGGHEPIGTSGGRRKSSGVRNASNGLTSGDFRRAGQELQRGARSIAKGIENAGRKIEKGVRKNWKPSDVSSQRPGESGREWGKHKYIDKVRTKSGKIRYIYNIDAGGQKQRDANGVHMVNDLKQKRALKKNQQRVTDARTKNLEAAVRQERQRNSLGGRARAFVKNLFNR